MLNLILISSSGQEETFSLTEKNSYIGRVPVMNEVHIDHPSLSRQHARIKRLKQGYAIYDLHSTNGVFLNGRKIEEAELNDGDEIRLGDVTLRVSLLSGSERSSRKSETSPKDVDQIENKMAVETLNRKKNTSST